VFGLTKKGPNKPFVHTDDCRILAADPDVQIQWNELETGFWVAECVCGKEYHHDQPADDLVRLDPFDPSTSRHLPQCEFVSETDPSVLKLLLKVTPGLGGGYHWVTCGDCQASWQVAYFVAAS
jgi:hypothetical protein